MLGPARSGAPALAGRPRTDVPRLSRGGRDPRRCAAARPPGAGARCRRTADGALVLVLGAGGRVRREDHVLQRPQRAVVRQRLLGEDVQARAAEMTVAQRVHERRLVDHRAAADVTTTAPGRSARSVAASTSPRWRPSAGA